MLETGQTSVFSFRSCGTLGWWQLQTPWGRRCEKYLCKHWVCIKFGNHRKRNSWLHRYAIRQLGLYWRAFSASLGLAPQPLWKYSSLAYWEYALFSWRPTKVRDLEFRRKLIPQPTCYFRSGTFSRLWPNLGLSNLHLAQTAPKDCNWYQKHTWKFNLPSQLWYLIWHLYRKDIWPYKRDVSLSESLLSQTRRFSLQTTHGICLCLNRAISQWFISQPFAEKLENGLHCPYISSSDRSTVLWEARLLLDSKFGPTVWLQ